ncbi:MAG: anti-sigma factor family protein [Vicinamibacteria bacterium]
MRITCREFIEFLMDYISGELPEDQRSKLVEHLAVCPSCVAYMNTYLETVELGREAFSDIDAPLPEDVPEALVQAILDARKADDRRT